MHWVDNLGMKVSLWSSLDGIEQSAYGLIAT